MFSEGTTKGLKHLPGSFNIHHSIKILGSCDKNMYSVGVYPTVDSELYSKKKKNVPCKIIL